MCRTAITDAHSKSSGYAPEAVANPRTAKGGATFLVTLRDEPVACWGVKTRWELVEERMAFESRAVREMTRAPAAAEVREEIIKVREKLRYGLGAER
jgi:hypothetical protein